MIAGSALYALASRNFRVEWFANRADFFNHVAGGALMGIGGVLAMGCTVGQGSGLCEPLPPQALLDWALRRTPPPLPSRPRAPVPKVFPDVLPDVPARAIP